MGGKALTVPVRRYEKKEFLALKDEVVGILNADFKWVTVPLYYREKESFGDLDVIIAWDKISEGQDLRKYIEEVFKPKEIFHTTNSNSWSFDYKECQVDFIMCDEKDFWCHYHYFAYNDLGNFIGGIARNVGMKYGQQGLVYDHFFKGVKVGRVNVSRNYLDIFKFLDLDYTRFMMGFDNMEEIFEFIKSSKYFNSQRYQLENLDKNNRSRNLKRVNYLKFIDYINENPKDAEYTYAPDKTKYITLAKEFFNDFNFERETREMEYNETKKLLIKAKFNGNEITKRFGYTGKELGEKIVLFKNILASSEIDFNDFILNHSDEYIYHFFKTSMGVK